MVVKTTRLDLLMVERGLVPSRQIAQTAIMDGGVLVNGEKVTKPGTPIKPDARVELLSQWQQPAYVSRGGLKLERALDCFKVDPQGKICLDLGASTGGFTDCLLKRGARLVYAIDVGYGQLDWSLRSDERVVVRERTNVRNLLPEDLYKRDSETATLAVADLSFISLTKILPAAVALLQAEQSQMVALIKPQFEAGREAVGKGGVVRSAATHQEVLERVVEFAQDVGLQTMAITHSPIKGPAGNIEFLALWQNSGESARLNFADIVNTAHTDLTEAK